MTYFNKLKTVTLLEVFEPIFCQSLFSVFYNSVSVYNYIIFIPRFLKKESQKPESLSRVTAVVSDRIRVPWLWGGAQKVDLSIVPPLILLPVLLHIASIHFLLGIVVLTALPVLVLWYYYFTHRKKGQTLFFLSLALFSLAYMYYLFITEVLPRGDIGPIQLSVITLGVILTLATLIHSKRDPGIISPNSDSVHSTVTYYGLQAESDPAVSSGRQDVAMTVSNRAAPSDKSVKDSKNWCSVCKVERPPRTGHCRICGVCVLRLDHHCVWWVHLNLLRLSVFFYCVQVCNVCVFVNSPGLGSTAAWGRPTIAASFSHSSPSS